MWLNLAIAIGGLVGGLGGLAAAFVAWIALRDSHSDRKTSFIDERIEHALAPVGAKLAELVQKLEAHVASTPGVMEAAVERGTRVVQEQVKVLETKMDVVWAMWKSLAVDAAKILHQPDPARRMIDVLLEHFMEDILTLDEELELRRYLVKIRGWEPGKDVGFPVHAGEQTAAAILLRTMDHAITPRRDRSRGEDRDE